MKKNVFLFIIFTVFLFVGCEGFQGPEILSVSNYYVLPGEDISVYVSESGELYLVDAAVNPVLSDLESAVPSQGIKISITEGTAGIFSSVSLNVGTDYVLYAVDAEGNLSLPSSVIRYRSSIVFDLEFTCGTAVPFGTAARNWGEKCYAVWMQNTGSSFLQNIFVCNQIRNINISHSLLPYWETNIETVSVDAEVDAVTSATHSISPLGKDTNFSLENITLSSPDMKQFTVYFEISRSWDTNDWFTGDDDQPAVLYAADIDFTKPSSSYTLTPIGWTPNSTNEVPAGIVINNWLLNTLNTEMRYITHKRNSNNTFGAVDTENAAVKMVGSIQLKVK